MQGVKTPTLVAYYDKLVEVVENLVGEGGNEKKGGRTFKNEEVF